jgi:hypothetical protein
MTYFEVLSMITYAPWNFLLLNLRHPPSKSDLIKERSDTIDDYVTIWDEQATYQKCIDGLERNSGFVCRHPKSPSLETHKQRCNHAEAELLRIDRRIEIIGQRIERKMKQEWH